ncbi:MAG: 4-hydroxy-tetrahydrodipicolinate reductase [Deltaproteobacteria bacterium]|nr:4-hydroxy-tetrahydrodipicolinate reductase [Deltaproteobacteria bacterium]
MVNIILAGAAGRMGQAILNVLPSFRGLSLAGAVAEKGHPKDGKPIYKNTRLSSDISGIINNGDVLVDFTTAEASINNLKIAAASKKPVVIGTTGHSPEQRSEILSLSKIVPVVFSPNMSVGVNLMWKLIEESASVLEKDYQIDIIETHHVHKKDAPSGTAKKMIEAVAASGGYDLKKIKVKSIREGEVVGDHTILFTSPYERLEITHRAFSREVFAAGALRAALWVVDKKAGLYSMSDVLDIVSG